MLSGFFVLLCYLDFSVGCSFYVSFFVHSLEAFITTHQVLTKMA